MSRETKRKPKVGEILFSLNVGNAARNRPQVLTKVRVESVGRKYFKVREVGDKYLWEDKYFIEDWRQETGGYTATSCLYESEQEYFEELEHSNICDMLREIFKGYGTPDISLKTLQKVKKLIMEDKS